MYGILPNAGTFNSCFIMKKITNKSLQTALLRGAVAISEGMCAVITSLFINDIYGVIATLCIGSGLICLINSHIK